MEGVNKKLSLLGGDSVDIFKGIPFATAKTLENPQRHPGWQGECWVLNARCWVLGSWLALAGCLYTLPFSHCRDAEGYRLQETMPTGHHYPGRHLWARRLPLPQYLGPPGQEARSGSQFPKGRNPTPTPELQSLVWVPFGAAKLNSPKIGTEPRSGCPPLILTALAEHLLQHGY